MSERLRLQPIELLLVFFGLTLFLSSLSLFMSEVSLRKYLLGWQDEGQLEKVGILDKSAGGILRKTAVQAEFKNIDLKSDVYNFDTIVTGPESSATVELSDGSVIELAPKTMVKLVFESRFSLAGISRATTVNVVSGKVKGKRRKAKTKTQAPAQKILLKPLVVEKATPAKEIEAAAEEKEEIVQVALPDPEVLYQAAEPVVLPETSVQEIPETAAKKAAEAPVPETPVAQVNLEPEQDIITAPEIELPPEVVKTEPPKPKVAKRIKLLGPRSGSTFSVKEGSTKAVVPVNFKWQKTPADLPVRLTVKRRGGQNFVSKEFKGKSKTGRFFASIDKPGTYEWKVQEIAPVKEGGEQQTGELTSTKGGFRVNPNFFGIRLQDPLVGGQKV